MKERNDQIRQDAKRLHLSNVKNNLTELLKEAESRHMSYESFLEHIFRQELKCRERTACLKRMRDAGFPYEKRLEDFDYSFMTSLTKREVNELAELNWVEEPYHLVLVGPPGTGKTHLAVALGIEAVEKGLTVSFTTMRQLLKLLTTEEENARSRSRLDKIRKSKLVILDEVGYLPVKPREAGLFFHLLNERIDKCSFIITSNKSFDKWAELFGDVDMVLAAMDRIIYRSEVIQFSGESYRLEHRKTILNRKES